MCSAHYIREQVVSDPVLESMQRVLKNVKIFERKFAQKKMECCGENKKKELAERRRELHRAKKRIAEIDGLIQKLYEDNAKGKLSDDRYATLSMAYEDEKQKLNAAFLEMQSHLETAMDKDGPYPAGRTARQGPAAG
ncbi:MAG: hypothetical protein II628_06305 [Lachnospiraceae bacterium]|nr:hypothetical protein [Lachnospiraceae bacterium]